MNELRTFTFQEKALHIPTLNLHFKEWSTKKEQLKMVRFLLMSIISGELGGID